MKIENCKLKINFLSSIFYLLSSAFLTTATAFAIDPTTPNAQTNPYTAPNTNPDVPNNLHTYTQNVTIEIMSALSCQLTGIDPTNPNQACLGVDQKTGKIGFVQADEGGGGAIGVMGKMISVLYTPPLHSGDYFNHLAQNFGIAKPAYAQGTGFEGLKPLLGLWTAFRNIVYLIFTIVFVVIGLAIMFRIKIDPRTVMTIQNQIPKIIIGIVLVTFSYAIAGFLIDMMYASIYLIGNVTTSASKQSPAVVTGLIQSDNPFSAAGQIGGDGGNAALGLKDIAWKPAETASAFISPIFDNPAGRIVMGIIVGFIGNHVRTVTTSAGTVAVGAAKTFTTVAGLALSPFTGGASIGVSAGVNTALTAVGNFFTKIGKPATLTQDIVTRRPDAALIADSAGAIVGFATGAIFAKEIFSGIASLIFFLVIAIAIIWALFRLWFILIYAYIYILIDVVFAPFWIAGGIIPGQPITFGGWLRHILSYIAAFPTTIALFLLGKVFIEAFGTDEKGFVPPLIGNPTDTNALGAIIGLGIILLSSNVVNITTKLFKAPRIDLGRISQAIGVGAGAPISAVKTGVGGILAGQEYILGPGNQPRQRGVSSSIFGRFFGR